MVDHISQIGRKSIIKQIQSETNKSRKADSLKQFEIQQGRIAQYVKENLRGSYFASTVREMNVVSSINIQRRVTNAKSTVYKHGVTRTFEGLNEDQQEIANLIYSDMQFNQKMHKANKIYNYQEQVIGAIIPKKGKLICKIFNLHHVDAIPSLEDSEEADTIIYSVFDREQYLMTESELPQRDNATGYQGYSNRSIPSITDAKLDISTEYDYKKSLERYIVWSIKYHYVMDGNGLVLDPETMQPSSEIDIESPLARAGFNILPFFDVHREKDFEFFVRPSNSLTDFTVEFNTRLSDLNSNIKMNGYSVAILKAPSDMQPENQTIGPAMILKLNTDHGSDKEVDFSFASPQSNIAEISDATDKFLNYFLTTEGLSSNVVNSSGQSEKHTSAIDRFIAILDRMSAHADDYEAFRNAEMQVWEIIKAWQVALSASDSLDSKYKIAGLPLDSKVSIKFEKPDFVKTESEKLDEVIRKLENGLISKIEAIMDLRGISFEQAQEVIKNIDSEETLEE